MTPGLSRRLGRALGRHEVTPRERMRIVDAAQSAETWESLPAGIRRLVEKIEARPGGVPQHIEHLEQHPPGSP